MSVRHSLQYFGIALFLELLTSLALCVYILWLVLRRPLPPRATSPLPAVSVSHQEPSCRRMLCRLMAPGMHARLWGEPGWGCCHSWGVSRAHVTAPVQAAVAGLRGGGRLLSSQVHSRAGTMLPIGRQHCRPCRLTGQGRLVFCRYPLAPAWASSAVL